MSVAMTTYNGSRFLDAQLESIAAQTRQPMELVIADDGSSDETVKIAERFAVRAPFKVRVLGSLGRRGIVENFMRAARAASGDLIAWSDQDDIWMPGKLARCAQEFESDAQVRLVVHSRQIGERTRRGRPLIRGGPTSSPSRLTRRRRVLQGDSLPADFGAPGFASVLDRHVLEIVTGLPGALNDWGHDTGTAYLAAAMGKVVFLPDVLAYYRQHGGNAIGAPPSESLADRVHAYASRDSSAFESELERDASISFFRAVVLRELGDLTRSESPSVRAGVWHRRGMLSARRLELHQRSRSNGLSIWSVTSRIGTTVAEVEGALVRQRCSATFSTSPGEPSVPNFRWPSHLGITP